jgi:hypothetical protein
MEKTFCKVIFTACTLLFCLVVRAQTPSDPVGAWTYSIPEAPYEYSTGKAEFKKVDGKLTMTMTSGDYPAIPLEVTVKENNVYVCKFSSTEFAMTITLKPDGDNLKGTVGSDQWEVSITLKPDKK